MRHIIELSEVANLEHKFVLAGSYGEFENKSLTMVVNSTDPVNKFVVCKRHKQIAVFVDIEKAIELYNNI